MIITDQKKLRVVSRETSTQEVQDLKLIERLRNRIEKRSGAKPFKIVNKETGKTVGSSTTKSKAQASARARMAGHKK